MGSCVSTCTLIRWACAVLTALGFVAPIQAAAPDPQEPAKRVPDREAILAFVREPLRFDSFIFNGDQFPACDFEHPAKVEKLIGRYTLKTTWYNDAPDIVTRPGKEAGRYAAVVEIQSAVRTSRRFFTLYHLAGNGKWTINAVDTALTLPPGTGIEPDIVKSQRDDIDHLSTKALSAALKNDRDGASMLAGMRDLSLLRRTGKLAETDHASYRDRQWWVDFKRKYYGYDKLYPNRFICPKPLAGKPAATIRSGTPAEAGMKADAVAAIESAAETWVKENGTGFGLCVLRHGVIVVNKGYGRWQGKAVSPEMPAEMASTTKLFNAICLLEMVDQGLIGFEEPVEKYSSALQGVKVKRSMTVRDLYLHLAGFSGNEGDTWPDMEEVIADMYPALEVGVRHQYQAVGHVLASKIMEMMSGEAMPYFYQNHLYRPLGCANSKFNYPATGSSGTAIDMARIGQMLLNGGSYGDKYFFSPKTLAQMMPIPGKDRFPPDQTLRWGVGIKTLDADGLSDQAFGHSGGSGSLLMIDPKSDLVIAVARNAEGVAFSLFLKQRAKLIGAVLAAIDRTEK